MYRLQLRALLRASAFGNIKIMVPMVVDRGNAKVAYLYSTYNPAVLRAIKYVIKSAKKENIMVGMCGEAAADELLIPLLLAYGLDEFSVSATSVLSTRKTISMWSKEEADVLLDKVEQLVIEEEVKNCLKANIK